MGNQIQQDIMAGSKKTAIRIAEATVSGSAVTAFTRAAPFASTGAAGTDYSPGDIIGQITRDVTRAAEADTEFLDQALIDDQINYRITSNPKFVRPSDGAILATTDEQDTITFEFAGTSTQEKALDAYKTAKTPLLIVTAKTNNFTSGAPDHFIMFLCKITEVNSNQASGYENPTFTVTGVSDLTTAMLFSEINTALEFATDKFYSAGDDDVTDGVTCTGLADAADVTAIFSGSYQLIDQ